MRIDPDAVWMTWGEFECLPEYSCSLPTGTAQGKRWRRRWPYRTDDPRPAQWHMGEYGAPECDSVPIIWREIFIEQIEGAE